MKKVFQLDSFTDIRKAFDGCRDTGDEVPMIEEKAMLHIDGTELRLDSSVFVLSESLRGKGREFVLNCISEAVGNRFTAYKLR